MSGLGRLQTGGFQAGRQRLLPFARERTLGRLTHRQASSSRCEDGGCTAGHPPLSLHTCILELYRRFVELRATANSVGKLTPYNWTAMPERASTSAWMASFGDDATSSARELAKSMTASTLNVRRLSAWENLMTSLGEEEKAEALHEFIEPIATLCLLTPYVIRSRLLFATAHLCHQVNLARETDWPEASLPVDGEIWMDSADRQGAPWRKYNRLKTRIEAISGTRQRHGHRRCPERFTQPAAHRASGQASRTSRLGT